jgi:hypothetical protein
MRLGIDGSHAEGRNQSSGKVLRKLVKRLGNRREVLLWFPGVSMLDLRFWGSFGRFNRNILKFR